MSSLDWLEYLAKAAKKVLLSNTSDKPVERQLLTYGQRRAKKFLGVSKEQWPPFFGLGKDSILAGLAEEIDEERAIAYLRAFAMENSYHSSEAYICFERSDCQSLHSKIPNDSLKICEYITAVPYTCASRKRDVNGNQLKENVHARWLYLECLEGSADKDPLAKEVLKERLQYFAARGERDTRIREAPVEIPLKKEWARKNPPLLFDYKRHSQLEYTLSSDTDSPSSDTDDYRCPSISHSDVLCRCFDFDVHTEQSAGLSKFSPVWTIGKYSIYVNDTFKKPSRHPLENGIELRGEMYLHPIISAKRVCKSSMKADTLSEYLQHMMNPSKRQSSKSQSSFLCRDDRGEQQLSDDEEEKPKEWYGWRDTFRTDQRGDHNLNKLHSADLEHAGRINYAHELADKWPMSREHRRALKALAIATRVYLQLDEATISLKVVESPLDQAPWLNIDTANTGQLNFRHFPRSSTLACIVHFESGALILEPDELAETIAIASGNSIFVIGALISDPFENLAASSVRRIIGNIGRNGIRMLVAPTEPKCRALGNEYNLVEHAAYDGKREDNFKATSLHLSFTDWTMALDVKGAEGRTIDQEAYMVESVISVLDSGKWVADLDERRLLPRAWKLGGAACGGQYFVSKRSSPCCGSFGTRDVLFGLSRFCP